MQTMQTPKKTKSRKTKTLSQKQKNDIFEPCVPSTVINKWPKLEENEKIILDCMMWNTESPSQALIVLKNLTAYVNYRIK